MDTMKRYLATLVLLASCASAPRTVADARVLSDRGTRHGTAVLVETDDEGRSWWLTNAHVVRGADRRAVAVDGFSTREVYEFSGFVDRDLHVVVDAALVATDRSDAIPTDESVGVWVPEPGEVVVVETLRGREFARMRPTTGHYQFALLDAESEIVPGDSGSPVFDADGALVGLVFASSEQRGHVGLLTPLWAIREALRGKRLAWILK